MTYPIYPNYPIYDLNDRNAATPVNIKELEEEDEAEIQLLAHNHESYESYDESYEAANKNSFVGTEEVINDNFIKSRCPLWLHTGFYEPLAAKSFSTQYEIKGD